MQVFTIKALGHKNSFIAIQTASKSVPITSPFSEDLNFFWKWPFFTLLTCSQVILVTCSVQTNMNCVLVWRGCSVETKNRNSDPIKHGFGECIMTSDGSGHLQVEHSVPGCSVSMFSTTRNNTFQIWPVHPAGALAQSYVLIQNQTKIRHAHWQNCLA